MNAIRKTTIPTYPVVVPYGIAEFAFEYDAFEFARWSSEKSPGYIIEVREPVRHGKQPKVIAKFLRGERIKTPDEVCRDDPNWVVHSRPGEGRPPFCI